MIGYYLIAGIMFIVSLYVSNKLKGKFKNYSKMHLQNGMSGKEIAEKMLRDNGIYDVKVISTPGMLSDHYNPNKKMKIATSHETTKFQHTRKHEGKKKKKKKKRRKRKE